MHTAFLSNQRKFYHKLWGIDDLEEGYYASSILLQSCRIHNANGVDNTWRMLTAKDAGR